MIESGVGLSGDGDCEGEEMAAMGYFFSPPAAPGTTLGCVELTE